MISRTVKPSARDKILAAAFALVRARGYSATTVDDLCAAAGVTKGAFFHHFKSKEDLAVAPRAAPAPPHRLEACATKPSQSL